MHKYVKITALPALALALAALPGVARADDEPDFRTIVSTPAARLADVDYGLAVVTFQSEEGEEQLYVWSGYYESAFLLVSLAPDDVYDLAGTPLGTQIQFAVEGNLGTVTLTNLGNGDFAGTYNGLPFAFHQEAALSAQYDGGWPQALAEARVPALQALGRTQEAAIAQAVLNAFPR
jgi:hypothetical protein